MGYISKATRESGIDRKYVTGLCEGANVRTTIGWRRIEHVKAGDLLVTRDDGLQPVRMVWTRTITPTELQANPSLAPIRLKPRAIGPMMPSHDICIAPSHRVLIPGYRISGVPSDRSYLMPVDAVATLNDSAYVDRSAENLTYYNLVFDTHQVICVAGLPVESFRPSPKSIKVMDIEAQEEIIELFPNLAKNRCAYPMISHPVARSRAFLADQI